MIALGDGEKAAEMRREIQEISLRSDMESFKVEKDVLLLCVFDLFQKGCKSRIRNGGFRALAFAERLGGA